MKPFYDDRAFLLVCTLNILLAFILIETFQFDIMKALNLEIVRVARRSQPNQSFL